MEQHTYWQVLKNSDRTEGRGPMLPTDIAFTLQASALEFVKSDHYAKQYGVMGTPGSDYCVKEVTVFVYESMDEYNENRPERVEERKRQKALSKLSEEDRRVLGLEDN
tara:strand:- start:3120 stop:3443 length:324 start_codon:yes stop_codon:yes gene_type:complete